MTEMTGDDADRSRYRALSVPSRRRLMAHLREADDGRGAAELADATGLSVATVRHHLAVLADAGLVRATAHAGPGRGRPRLTWVAVGPPPGHEAPLQELAGALTEALAGSPDAARAAGRTWGRTRAAPDGEGVAQVMAHAARMGFAPEAAPAPAGTHRVLLHGCPYRELARARPEVICSVHQGMLDGLLDGSGTRARLRPFVTPTLCAAELQKGD